MVNHGKQRSTVKPNEIELNELKVFVASNIVDVIEDESEFTGFEFDLVEYGKDEYIRLQAEKNIDLENQLEDTQFALCEVYELLI